VLVQATRARAPGSPSPAYSAAWPSIARPVRRLGVELSAFLVLLRRPQSAVRQDDRNYVFRKLTFTPSGSVAEWLACWMDSGAEGPGFISQSRRWRVTVHTVHTHRASVHQAAKLVAAVLKVAGVTAGLTESNGSLSPGL